MENIYISLVNKTLDSTRQEATEQYQHDTGEKDHSCYNASLDIDTVDLENETFSISGDIIYENQNLGYVSINFTPGLDVIIALIQVYMKKLGKLKTVLEATK